MSLSNERLAQIRALGDDELRTHFDMDRAVDDLLREVVRLRMSVGSLAGMLRTTAKVLAADGHLKTAEYIRISVDEIAGGA